MSLIKLIALDLDDTLLHNDLTISPRAKEAIRLSAEKGVKVTLATGRMFVSALPYALELGLNIPLITYQGALVKYATGQVVYHQPIPLPLAKELVDFILPYGCHLNVYVGDELFMRGNTPEGRRYQAMAKVPVHLADNLGEALTEGPSKLLVIGESKALEPVAHGLKNTFGSRINLTKSRSDFLELSDPRATKGQALKSLAESLGIARECVMAFGDNLNDLDMVQYAGLGVAMENAMPELKEAARYITKTNNDDGVAEAIEKFVL